MASATEDRGGMTEVMYNWRVAAINKALAKLGKATGPLTIDDLTSLGHLDQYHYLGVEANKKAATLLGMQKGCSILDVGSGIGGPARYFAHHNGCKVTAVELQTDLNKAAAELSDRASLGSQIDFLTGDFVAISKEKLADATFDHSLSLLTILHIPNRKEVLSEMFRTLKPGGTFLVEDFIAQSPFTAEEQGWLANVVSAASVTSAADYVAELKSVGFVDVEVLDLTAIWQKWTAARHRLFVESKEDAIANYGAEVFKSRSEFYQVIDNLFAGKHLGGACITARKPCQLEQQLIDGRNVVKAKGSTDGIEVKVIETETAVWDAK